MMKSSSVNISQAYTQMRLDSNFHLSEGLVIRRQLQKSPYILSSIGEVTKDIYCPGIFRRNYLVNGIPFLGGADIQKVYYDSGKYLSKENTPNYKELEVKKGWTLVTCGGTIGDVVFANGLIEKCWLSQHIMRVIPDTSSITEGILYSFLASKYGKLLLTTGTYGTVIPTLNAESIANIPFPLFPQTIQSETDVLIKDSARLREDADVLLKEAEQLLKKSANLPELTTNDYDYFGQRTYERKVSCFKRSIRDIGTISFNAFNNSERINNLKHKINVPTIPVKDLLDGGQTFSSGTMPSIEVKPGHGIMLINQKDIFDNIIKGKYISKRGANLGNLVQYGEVLIASDGTLGESELFCRAVFANEDLTGAFLSSHFLRMRTTNEFPSGYLYCWLNSDYGFRLIRNTQAGTKICHPIPEMFLNIPVPVVEKDVMMQIDQMVRIAHTKRHEANKKELKAIKIVEDVIENW